MHTLIKFALGWLTTVIYLEAAILIAFFVFGIQVVAMVLLLAFLGTFSYWNTKKWLDVEDNKPRC